MSDEQLLRHYCQVIVDTDDNRDRERGFTIFKSGLVLASSMKVHRPSEEGMPTSLLSKRIYASKSDEYGPENIATAIIGASNLVVNINTDHGLTKVSECPELRVPAAGESPIDYTIEINLFTHHKDKHWIENFEYHSRVHAAVPEWRSRDVLAFCIAEQWRVAALNHWEIMAFVLPDGTCYREKDGNYYEWDWRGSGDVKNAANHK